MHQLLKHTDAGLATLALGIGVMGAEAYILHLAARRRNRPPHFFVNFLQHRQAEFASCNPRLIGHHIDIKAVSGEEGNGFQRPRYRYPFRRRLDVVGGILIDDPIAVEDDKRTHDRLGALLQQRKVCHFQEEASDLLQERETILFDSFVIRHDEHLVEKTVYIRLQCGKDGKLSGDFFRAV